MKYPNVLFFDLNSPVGVLLPIEHMGRGTDDVTSDGRSNHGAGMTSFFASKVRATSVSGKHLVHLLFLS